MKFEWRKFKRHPFVRAGLPFLTFTVLGFLGLQKFVQGKHQLEDLSRGRKTLTTREYDLEEDYRKTLNKLKATGGGYDNKPIPRRDD
jgi:hypothetical protein